MNLYEIDIGSLWWISSIDEFEAIEILREELMIREISEEEIDDVMDDMLVKFLSQEEAEMIDSPDGSEDYSVDSIWDLFIESYGSELLSTDFYLENIEEDDDGEEDYF